MPRSSRHKSHRQKHRDSREHSDSEEEDLSRERRRREDSGVRVSDSAEKKESPLKLQQEKDLPVDYGSSKRRRDRADSAVSDRWNGGEDRRGDEPASEKGVKSDGFGSDSEKRSKAKTAEDSKSRSSRRQESSSERKNEILVAENEEAKKGSGRVESKRKLEKDLCRKDANEHKDGKEKEKEKEKERGTDRDRKVTDARHEKSVDNTTGMTGSGSEKSRKQGTHTGGSDEKGHSKREVEITESQVQDELRNAESEKELERRIRKRDGSSDKDKRQEDVRASEDRRLSSKDDRLKNGRCKDERHKDSKYRDKYQEDVDKGQRYRDDTHKEERSIDRTIDRSDKSSESRHKKAKLQGNNHDSSPCFDDQNIGNKDNRVRKRSSDELDDHSDLNSQTTKEHRIDVEKSSLTSRKLDSVADRGHSESHHHRSDVVNHSTPSSSTLKCSLSSSAHVVKDQCRHGSKKAESRDTFSEERNQPNSASTREVVSAYKGTDKVSEPLPMDKQDKVDHNHLTELLVENAACPHYGRSPKSVQQLSPMQSTEKSPSSTSGDRRYVGKTGVKRSLEAEEMGWRKNESKDTRDYSAIRARDWELPVEKNSVDDLCQVEFDGEAAPVSSTSRIASRSPSLPPPPFRSPSVLGSSEEESRVAAGRKSNNHLRRSGDPNMGRGQGNAWKGVPNWPSPVTNGFIPFQHGPPSGGFHAVMQQFPSTPLFGVRPTMELNHPGVSFPMHDADRFSGHARPFGWRTPAEDSCPPHMHAWDGSNGVFGDESQIYGRPDWDQNRHVISSRAWEVNTDMWKGQNGHVMAELHPSKNELDYSSRVSLDEHLSGHASQQSRSDRNQPECFLPVKTEVNRSDVTPVKSTAEEHQIIVHEKAPKSSNISNDSSGLCCMYLSLLDISVDLTSPELYQQCTSLFKMERGPSNENKLVSPEDQIEVVESKNTSHILRDSLFPAITETACQRAMDLYKKQQMTLKISAAPSDSSKVDKVSPASGGEELAPAQHHSSPDNMLLGLSSNEEGGDKASSNSKQDLSDDSREHQSDSKPDLSDDSEEHQSNTISHTISGPIVSTVGSQASEVLMPDSDECRVNLSRIHIPPESTH